MSRDGLASPSLLCLYNLSSGIKTTRCWSCELRIEEAKLRNVENVLLHERGDLPELFWPWLDDAFRSNRESTRKEANKFLLGVILDRQMKWEMAWANARKLTEECLADPDELWEKIGNMPLVEWNLLWRKHKFARFWKQTRVHVRQDAAILVERYSGDARNIWRESRNTSEIERKLMQLHGVGRALASMAVGALWDTRQLPMTTPLDVKPDVHVCRVVGRVFNGEICTEQESREITRALHPKNPWVMDRPLFLLGQSHCHPFSPDCQSCYLSSYCEYKHTDK